jgi:hypothetical protein
MPDEPSERARGIARKLLLSGPVWRTHEHCCCATCEDRIATALQSAEERGKREAAADSRRLHAALAALRQVQWGNEAVDPDSGQLSPTVYNLCPMCDQSEVRGHAPDCLVGMALEDCGAGTVEPSPSEEGR